jgi:hypothetical protein
MSMNMPIEYKSFIRQNYAAFIHGKRLSSDRLERYIDGCFKDIERLRPQSRMWICTKCLSDGPQKLVIDSSYGHGDNPRVCDKCGGRTSPIGNFQARSGLVGKTFMYACYYLLTEKFKLSMTMSHADTRLYDLEVTNDVVIEAKGSPRVVANIDGSTSRLSRPGMRRSDTEKKAFANAEKWHALFPDGHFYILTNAIPDDLRGFRSRNVSAICDITNVNQLRKFVKELRGLKVKRPQHLRI